MKIIKILLMVFLNVFLMGNSIRAQLYACNNSVGGTWGAYGVIPSGCDIHPFTDPAVIHEKYEPLIFDTRLDLSTETKRYMSEMYAVVRDVVADYYLERNPSAPQNDVAAFQRAIFAAAHQETWWTHYRIGYDNREKIELGDFNHGHGMMQIDDRSHAVALQQGKGWDLSHHMIYALDIYYSGWQNALSASCYNNSPSYRNRARSAYAAYNGGPASICRWIYNTQGDINFADKYDNLGWQSQVVDLSMPASVDLHCMANGNIACQIGGNPDGSVIIDEDSNAFVKHGNEQYWFTKLGGINGAVTWTHAVDSQQENWAQWMFANVSKGEYELFVYIPQITGTTGQAQYTVRASGVNHSVTLNQNNHANQWASLGNYKLAQNGDEYLKLSDLTGEAYSLRREVAFDAIKLVPINGLPDLVISDVQMIPAQPVEGQDVMFSGVVTNMGNIATEGSIGVTYQINGQSVTWGAHFEPLLPGQSITIGTGGGHWVAPAASQISLRAIVDDLNQIHESNDNNNISTSSPYTIVVDPGGQNTGSITLPNGMCLDAHLGGVHQNGTHVQIWTCNNMPQQQWSHVSGQLVNGYGKCLDLHWADRFSDAGKVQIWDCNGQQNQQWSFQADGTLKNGFGKCLDAKGDEYHQDGGLVWTYYCHAGNNQKWQLTQELGVIEPPYVCSDDEVAHMKVSNLSGDLSVSLRSTYSDLDASHVITQLADQSSVKALDYVLDGYLVSDSALNDSSATWVKLDYFGTVGWVNSLYLELEDCKDQADENNDSRMKSFVYDWYLPVDSFTLSSDESDHLNRGSVNAWDISTPFGAPIYAMAAGEVIYTSCANEGGYGCWVYIDHGSWGGANFKTVYAHMISGSIDVTIGQQVTSTTQLGQVGWTGYTSFGPHVHFELRKNNSQHAVENYFDEQAMYYCPFCEFVE